MAHAKGASINYVQQSRRGVGALGGGAEQADSALGAHCPARLGFSDMQGCPSLLSAYCCWSIGVGCQNLARVWLSSIARAPAGWLAGRTLDVLAHAAGGAGEALRPEGRVLLRMHGRQAGKAAARGGQPPAAFIQEVCKVRRRRGVAAAVARPQPGLACGRGRSRGAGGMRLVLPGAEARRARRRAGRTMSPQRVRATSNCAHLCSRRRGGGPRARRSSFRSAPQSPPPAVPTTAAPSAAPSADRLP